MMNPGVPGVALFLLVLAGPARSQAVYVGDPDPGRPMLHVQPPAAIVPEGALPQPVPGGSINGITFIDTLVAAGIDQTGQDRGNEPALTVNPLNFNQIMLTAFSGSNWATGGNASLLYSGDGGLTWSYNLTIPPPTGTTTNFNCPCDLNADWGRDGTLNATFLHLNNGGSVQSVYSAQTATPTVAASWVYRTLAGVAQRTNQTGLNDVDQPWLWSGPLPGDNSQNQVCVAYDNFDAAFTNAQMRNSDSPNFNPLNFTRDAPANSDGQVYGDGMNPGTRIAIGPSGLIFNLFQRYVAAPTTTVKQLTYLLSVSGNGGTSWSVSNSDHISGAKIVAANVFSFQGNGSKVGGVNALLGGVDALNVDPASGVAWLVYGTRATAAAVDQLWLVSATYSAGSLLIGTPHVISPAGINAYLPAVAVLPSGEVGVLFLTWDGTNFTYRFIQTVDGGVTLAKNTTLTTFTSPFASTGSSNQRIFGDYLQLRAAGCNFYGTYPARGSGVNSAGSIDPYFMLAPAAAVCTPAALTGLTPAKVCAGGPAFTLSLNGSNFSSGATGRIRGALRATNFVAPTQVNASIAAADIVTAGSAAIDLLGAAPAGGLSGTQPLTIEAGVPASPGGTLRITKSGASNLTLSWSAAAGADNYNVNRCTPSGTLCTLIPVGVPVLNSYTDPALASATTFFYAIQSVNACGPVS